MIDRPKCILLSTPLPPPFLFKLWHLSISLPLFAWELCEQCRQATRLAASASCPIPLTRTPSPRENQKKDERILLCGMLWNRCMSMRAKEPAAFKLEECSRAPGHRRHPSRSKKRGSLPTSGAPAPSTIKRLKSKGTRGETTPPSPNAALPAKKPRGVPPLHRLSKTSWCSRWCKVSYCTVEGLLAAACANTRT